MEKFFWTVTILAIGLYMTYEGVMVRCDRLRKRFIGGSFPVLAPRDIFLISVPIGLGLISICFMVMNPDWNNIFGPLMLVFNLSAIILGIWRPD